MKLKIKTIWMGKVAVRSKYITKALEEKEDLVLVKGNDSMVIPCDKITTSVVGKSEQPVPDKFSNEFHYLHYFDWKPTTYQKHLL